MNIRILCASLAALLLANPIFAAEQHLVIQTDWSELPKRLTAIKTGNRKIIVTLTSGTIVKTRFAGISGDLLKIQSKRGGISADEIRSIRFEGATGNGHLIGLLTGLGAGAAISYAATNGLNTEKGSGVAIRGGIVAAVTAGMGIAGLVIGRKYDTPGPEYVIHH